MVLVQKLAELPKIGDRILVERFHVSNTNIRYDEAFGESEEDKKLIEHFKAGKKVVQPFKARLEPEGFGVYLGRRRFLAQKEAGTEYFVVGEDCLITDISDEEAQEASWIENFSEFHKEMNPITRAKGLTKFVSRWGLRGYARRSGIPASSLSEYLKVLELSSKMQSALAKDSISFRNGLKIARMNLDIELQDKLTEVLETQGIEAFEKECVHIKEAVELAEDKVSAKRASKKLAKHKKTETSSTVSEKDYWKQLTESLKEFADNFSDYCTIKEWEDADNYHLKLEAVMPKDLKAEDYESVDTPDDGLERLSSDESPQICGLCGHDILEGDTYKEENGFYYCGKCVQKAIKVES